MLRAQSIERWFQPMHPRSATAATAYTADRPSQRENLWSQQFSGQVSVAQWWSEVVTVPKGSKMFEVSLSWPGATDSLDLHLVSPSGRHYGWYGDTTGYSGSKTNPQEFHLPKPEIGMWRISVEGVRGSGPIEFGVETTRQETEPAISGIERRSGLCVLGLRSLVARGCPARRTPLLRILMPVVGSPGRGPAR